jgi:hypothetical protein
MCVCVSSSVILTNTVIREFNGGSDGDESNLSQ